MISTKYGKTRDSTVRRQVDRGVVETSMSSSQDVLSILVATDVHLGCWETEPDRNGDSYNSFEEILQLATEHKVDLVLLAGDLFHYAKPSPSATLRCITLLRNYCLGDTPISFRVITLPFVISQITRENFTTRFNLTFTYLLEFKRLVLILLCCLCLGFGYRVEAARRFEC